MPELDPQMAEILALMAEAMKDRPKRASLAPVEARAQANVGRPAVVMTGAGVRRDEEHTTIIRPGNVNSAQGPMMAQAGRLCLARVRLTTIFGSRPVELWVHD